MDAVTPESGLCIGSSVTVPDGRAGIVRFTYSGATGPTLVVRTEDAAMLVVPAADCVAAPHGTA